MLRNPGPTRIICEMARVYPVSPTPIAERSMELIWLLLILLSWFLVI